MANWKITFFFESAQQANVGADSSVGWTETFYGTLNGGPDAVYQHPDIAKYIKLRRNILADIYRISFIRISDDQHPRIVKIFNAGAGVFGSLKTTDPDAVGHDAAQVQCGILVDLQRLGTTPTEKVHHRRFIIRGLVTDVIKGNIIYNQSELWPQHLAFLNFIGQKDATIAGANKNGAALLGCRFQDATPQPQPVTAIQVGSTLTDDFHFGIVSPTLLLLTPGAKVKVTGVPDNRVLNRIWTYSQTVVSGGSNFYILGKARKPLTPYQPAVTAGIFAQLQQQDYGTFDQYTIIGLRSKRTGKVFRQLRGRSGTR